MDDSNSNRSIWHQVRIIVLLPLIIFLWMTGWTLYWIGTQRMSSRTAKKEKHNGFQKKKIIKETLSHSSYLPPQ